MKVDLRVEGSEKFVTVDEAIKMKKKIGAYALVECSAIQRKNLEQVFEQAIKAVEEHKTNNGLPQKKAVCGIL